MDRRFGKLLIAVALVAISCGKERYAGPLTPDEALKSFQLREGFKIELFAAEPDVMDPVEMVFDEQGNAFVAEMPDYPFKPEAGKGTGRIRVLQDTDGDGRIDRTVIFADSILEVTSMLPWKQGLIVTAAPNILYLKDTDGDFRADEREVLFTGFFENNSEAQITNLRLGVDNWIYAANNGQAGTVHFTRKPEAPALSMAGADFRFRLDRNEFEQESGAAQFGLTMDDWGHRFITQNTIHIRHAVIPWRYLHRHEHLRTGPAIINISDHDLEMFQQTPPPYWRAERTRRRQIQYKEQNLDRVEYAEDHFTGCSGGMVYDGDAFPREYYGNVFTGDVAGNLVHRDIIVPLKDRPTYVARRDEGEKAREFLASTDSWFRPASFTVGPDGYLYVIDMYRQHIETPLSIPEDLKSEMDFLAGVDRGRIYRIRPENHGGTKPVSNLRDMDSAELVKLLSHSNRWWRLQAQRLLLERQDGSVIPALKELFATHQDPRARLHALYSLEALNALDASLTRKAMEDSHPGVREHGIILSERYPELLPEIIERIQDSTIHVAFQATLSAGASADKKVADALAGVIDRHGDDPLFRIAVLSAQRPGSFMSLLNKLVADYSFLESEAPWKEAFLEELSYAIGSANQASEVNLFLDALSRGEIANHSQWQLAGANGLKRGLLRSAATDSPTKEKLETIETTNAGQITDALRELKELNAGRSAL